MYSAKERERERDLQSHVVRRLHFLGAESCDARACARKVPGAGSLPFCLAKLSLAQLPIRQILSVEYSPLRRRTAAFPHDRAMQRGSEQIQVKIPRGEKEGKARKERERERNKSRWNKSLRTCTGMQTYPRYTRFLRHLLADTLLTR